MKHILVIIAVAFICSCAFAIEVPLPTNVVVFGISVDRLNVDDNARFDLSTSEWKVEANPVGQPPKYADVDGVRVDYNIQVRLSLTASRAEVMGFLGYTNAVEFMEQTTIQQYYDGIWSVLLNKAVRSMREKQE